MEKNVDVTWVAISRYEVNILVGEFIQYCLLIFPDFLLYIPANGVKLANWKISLESVLGKY